MRVKQVRPHDRFPSGDYRDFVEIRFAPDELASRYGLRFAEGIDDLDLYKLAAISLADGSQAWFLKYRGDQFSGTLVRVDADANLAHAKELLKQALGLTESDFLWVTPAAEASAASA